jgi:enoyl-CoA hydratase
MAVRYERRGVAAILTIDRPERRNAIDGETAAELHSRLHDFSDDDDARVLIVTGAGDVAFCAGADLKAIETLEPHARGGPLGFTRLTSPKPTIAAVSGYAVAGGLELALWCDLRIATESAQFGCAERRWGVPLIDGGTQRLPRIVGLGRALDMILTGRMVDAQEALSIGLATRVVPDGAHIDTALETAELLAGFPQQTMNSDRRAVYEGVGLTLEEGIRIESRLGSEVLMEGVTGAGRFAAGAGRGGSPA